VGVSGIVRHCTLIHSRSTLWMVFLQRFFEPYRVHIPASH
jgi:hypothetical protein